MTELRAPGGACANAFDDLSSQAPVGIAAGGKKVVVVFICAVAEMVTADVVPEVFGRVEIGRIGR
jgi:hypothetical protein